MRPRLLAPMLIALVALSGCASSPHWRFFVLDAVGPEGAPATVAGAPITVHRVDLPAFLDRPEMVRRVDAQRIKVSDSARWGGPIKPMITEVLSEDLARRLPPAEAPLADSAATTRGARPLVVRIHDFAPWPSGKVKLDVSWQVGGGNGSHPISRRETIEVDAGGSDAAHQAAAMSRALGRLADEIVAALGKAPPSTAAPAGQGQ